MTDSQVIPTPLAQRWRRIRYSYMPIVFFILCLFLVFYVWKHHVAVTNAVGTYEQVRADISSGIEGMLLLPVGQRELWKEHDSVRQGQVLYRLDGQAVDAALAVLKADLKRIKSQLAATEEQIQFDVRDLQHDQTRELARLHIRVEERRLQVLELQAQIEVDTVEVQRRANRLDYYRRTNERRPDTIPSFTISEEQLRRDEVAKQIEVNKKLLKETKSQGIKAFDRLREYPILPPAAMEKLLAPIRQAATVQEARIAELKLQVDNLEIKAPFDGTITAINVWPGQYITAGTPVMTVAARHGRYIVSYIRQMQQIRPRVNDRVTVRLRIPGAMPMQGKIEQVGAQYEAVPRDQLRDYRTREYGRPVRIVLLNEKDRNLAIPPGELLDIGFRASGR